jgi:hypothetical protein
MAGARLTYKVNSPTRIVNHGALVKYQLCFENQDCHSQRARLFKLTFSFNHLAQFLWQYVIMRTHED